MSFRERWTKKFAESLTKDEKKAFKLWLDFSEGKCARGYTRDVFPSFFVMAIFSFLALIFTSLPRTRCNEHALQ